MAQGGTIREPSSRVGAGDDVDLVGDVFGSVFNEAGVEQQRFAELQLIAAHEFMFCGGAAVDESAVGAVQIAQDVAVAPAHQLRMFARDFRVVQTNRVVLVRPTVWTDSSNWKREPLIASLNDKQRSHFRAISVDEGETGLQPSWQPQEADFHGTEAGGAQARFPSTSSILRIRVAYW